MLKIYNQKRETGIYMNKPNINNTYITKRLKNSLEQIENYKMTTIVAPMGYGKSTAIKYWKKYYSQLNPEAIVLEQVVTGDSSSDFWRSFCHNLCKFPALSEDVQALGYPDNIESAMLLCELIERVVGDSNKSVYYILDDIHIFADSWFYSLLVLLAQRLPEQIHLILLSRNRVFGERERFKLGGRLFQITTNELCLTEDEICEYADACGVPLEKAQAASLLKTSEGWISLIYLIFCTYQQKNIWQFESLDIFQLIDEVVFGPLSERERRFVSVNSLSDGFNYEQAMYLWKDEDCGKLLHKLSQENAFISRGEDGVFRYHYMLRQVAVHHFEQMEEQDRLYYYERLAKWYKKEGDYLHAAINFEKCEDWDGLLAAFGEDMARSISPEQLPHVKRWMKECPEEALLRHPAAINVFMTILFYVRDIPQLMYYNQLFCRSMKENDSISDTERKMLEGESELRLSFLKFNNISAMSEHQRKIRMLQEGVRNPWTQGSPSVLMLYHSVEGKLDRENEEMRECMPIYCNVANGHGSGAMQCMQGETHLMRGEFSDAEISYYFALDEATSNNEFSVLVASEFLAARLALYQKDVQTGAVILEKLNDTLMKNRQYRLLTTAELAQAWFWALIGVETKIPRWILAEDNSISKVFPLIVPIFQIIVNQVLLVQEKWGQVVARRQTIEKMCTSPRYVMCSIYLGIQTAVALYKLDKKDEALQELKEALKLALPDRIYLPFAEADSCIDTLFDELKDDFPEAVTRIHEISDRFRQSLDGFWRKAAVKNNSFGLSKRELDIVHLVTEGSTNLEIANSLYISENTVKNHLNRIYDKIGIEGSARNKKMILRKVFSD